MAAGPERERFTLKRWSQRKHAAARDAPPAELPANAAPAGAVTAPPAAPAVPPEPPLPPVESLRFDDDFTAFMKPEVYPSLRRDALKKLFRDPRFNVMDGLDVYIDDYSKPDPIPPAILARLAHTRYLFDPPKTRVNERGEVEDVPPEADGGAPESSHAIADTPSQETPAAGADSAEAEPPSVERPDEDGMPAAAPKDRNS